MGGNLLQSQGWEANPARTLNVLVDGWVPVQALVVVYVARVAAGSTQLFVARVRTERGSRTVEGVDVRRKRCRPRGRKSILEEVAMAVLVTTEATAKRSIGLRAWEGTKRRVDCWLGEGEGEWSGAVCKCVVRRSQFDSCLCLDDKFSRKGPAIIQRK